jgi:hypothetical protein
MRIQESAINLLEEAHQRLAPVNHGPAGPVASYIGSCFQQAKDARMGEPITEAEVQKVYDHLAPARRNMDELQLQTKDTAMRPRGMSGCPRLPSSSDGGHRHDPGPLDPTWKGEILVETLRSLPNRPGSRPSTH